MIPSLSVFITLMFVWVVCEYFGLLMGYKDNLGDLVRCFRVSRTDFDLRIVFSLVLLRVFCLFYVVLRSVRSG